MVSDSKESYAIGISNTGTVRAVTYVRDSNQSINLSTTYVHIREHTFKKKNAPINSFYIFRQLAILLNF